VKLAAPSAVAALGAAGVLIALTSLAACGGNGDIERASAASRAGPQGAVGQFVVECALSHTAFDDPIVHPGEPGASHQHLFFGNRDVAANSSYESLAGGDTSCDQPRDTASYWAPALFDATGRTVQPIRAVAYYRAGPGVDPQSVQPYPPGLKMLGGDQHATSAQPLSVVGWSCGGGRPRSVSPPKCPGDSPLSLNVTFPDCWNGTDLDSPDHVSHTATSTGGRCPDSHPTPLPELVLVVDYPAVDPDGIELASGGVGTGHADFWNVWDQAKLETEVRGCLHRDVVCGVNG
jgi:hypothetical protein